MAGILETLYPQGDYLNIKANSPTRRDYNINVMADLVNNLPSQFSIAYPAAAATLSLPYDGIQALTRTTDKDFNQATTMGGLTGREIAADALGTAFAREAPFTSLRDRTIGASASLAEQLANSNLLDTVNNLFFTSANADTIPTEEERQAVEKGVQDFDLGGIREIISRMEEEKGNYIERPQNRFSMDGIMQNLKNYGKDAAGRYAASQFLKGAGTIIGGPTIGGIAAIAGLLGGGNLFNQNTYSQQMYNNLTSGGKQYADQLYGPGGVLQGYNQFSGFGRGTLGTIANNLAKNPNMSPARRNAYRTAADKYISGIDPTQQGYNAVTKKGGHGYDDAYINYSPPSGDRDSSGGGSQSFGDGFDSDQATL